jgi:hypothetical protein
VKTLRASGTRLQSDVVVGKNEYGGDVTVHVTLDRKDPEVVETLAPIQKLLRDRALGVLDRALEEEVVQQRVQARLTAERHRIQKSAKENAEHELQGRLRTLEAQLAAANRENTRLQQKLQASTEKEI